MRRSELEAGRAYAYAPSQGAKINNDLKRVVYRGSVRMEDSHRRRLGGGPSIKTLLEFELENGRRFRLLDGHAIHMPWEEWEEGQAQRDAAQEAQSLQRQEDYQRAMRAIQRLGISYSLLKIEHGGGEAMVTLSMPLSELRHLAERAVDAEAAS